MREHDLLVLAAAGNRGLDALALPFRRATVLDPADALGRDVLDGSYDIAVVDLSPFDLSVVDRLVPRILPVLRQEGRILVMLGDPSGAVHTQSPTSSLDTQGWGGLTELRGRPCAVLRPGGPPGPAPVSVLLSTADAASRLAAVAARDADERAAALKAALLRRTEESRRSEQALLHQLSVLVVGPTDAPRESEGLLQARTVLRRSKAGRAVLRGLRPLKPVVVRLASRKR